MRIGLRVLLLCCVSLCASLSFTSEVQAQWGASASVFSDDGVELNLDSRVISLFVLMNRAGYDSEILIGPEPLKKPLFSKMRQTIRRQKGRVSQNQVHFEKLLVQYPQRVSYYIDAILRLGQAPKFTPAKRTKKLTRKLHPLVQKWYVEGGGSSIFQTIAFTGSQKSKFLLPLLNKKTKAINILFPSLGSDESLLEENADDKERVVLSYNPLDAHQSLYRLKVNGVHYVVYGPTHDLSFNEQVISASSLAYIRSILDPKISHLKLNNSSWKNGFDNLTITEKKYFRNLHNYMSEIISCLIHQKMSVKNTCASSILWSEGALKMNALLQQKLLVEIQEWLNSKENVDVLLQKMSQKAAI